MVLYKNVDVCDLKSIMQRGILSMDECGNKNWDEGKRAGNDTSVVYLFEPAGKINSFCNYGVALLEVECEASENSMSEADIHRNDYKEFITKKVRPSEIRRVIIPEIFKHHLDVPDGIDVTWCGFYAEHYGKDGLEKCDSETLEKFAETSQLADSQEFNFFRGMREDRTMIDLYNVRYIF